MSCDGTGKGKENKECEDCKGTRYFVLDHCPRKFIGTEITNEINLAGFASKGHLPEPGGMLDQDAWFVDMWSVLSEDQSKIEEEIRKRNKR